MKIRNLAFCGVMASILGVSGAYAATDATIIASKAYVDARDNTKQDNSDRVTTTWAAAVTAGVDNSEVKYPSMKTLKDVKDGLETSISTNVTNNAYDQNALAADAADNGKLTKVSAIKGAASTTKLTTVTNGVASVGTGDDEHFATTKAIADTFKDLDHKTNTDVTNASTAVTAVTQADGQVSVTSGTLGTAAIDENAKENGNTVISEKAGNLVTVKGVQASIAKQGSLEKAWNDREFFNNEENSAAANAAGAKLLFDAAATNMAKADQYVPTVKAVEMRVKQAEDAARSATSNAVVDNWTNADGDTTHAPSRNVVYDSINVANDGNVIRAGTAVNTNLTALDTKIGNTTMGTTDTTLTGAIAEVKATADGALKDVTQGSGAGEAYVALEKDGTNVKGTKGILTYSGALDHKLSEINTSGGNGSGNCTKRSPCTLTMVMDNGTPVYEWTNMDTDGLDGVL